MPDIRFACPRCGKHLLVDERSAGMTVRCPDCGSSQVVPRPGGGVGGPAPGQPRARPARRFATPLVALAVTLIVVAVIAVPLSVHMIKERLRPVTQTGDAAMTPESRGGTAEIRDGGQTAPHAPAPTEPGAEDQDRTAARGERDRCERARGAAEAAGARGEAALWGQAEAGMRQAEGLFSAGDFGAARREWAKAAETYARSAQQASSRPVTLPAPTTPVAEAPPPAPAPPPQRTRFNPFEAAVSVASRAAASPRQMATIRIPELCFRAATLAEVMDWLRGECGINFALDARITSTPPISCTLHDASLLRILRIVTCLSDVNYRVTGDIVTLVPCDPAAAREQAAWEERLERAAGRDPSADARALSAKLSKIIIPAVEFRQAVIWDAAQFLVMASQENDAVTGPALKKGIDIAVKLPPSVASVESPADIFAEGAGSDPPSITCSLRNVSLKDALAVTANLAGMECRTDGDRTIVLIPVQK